MRREQRPKAAGTRTEFCARLSFSWRFPGIRLRLQAAQAHPGGPVAYRWAVLATR